MNITVQPRQIQAFPADALIVSLFEAVTTPGGAAGAIDTALGSADGVPGDGPLSRIMALGDFKAKLNDTLVLYTHGLIPAPRVIVVGLGKSAEFNAERAREASGTAARKAQDLGCKRVATIAHGAGKGGLDARIAAQATVEGALLGAYAFSEYRTTKSGAIEELAVLEPSPERLEAVQAGAADGDAIARAQNDARTLANRPPNALYPETLATWCSEMAGRTGLRCQVMQPDEIARLGMGGVLGVCQGSDHGPRFVVLEHDPGSKEVSPLVFVGKGVTFDTGGYSIKSADGMLGMKGDMSGAAAVAAALQAAATLRVPRRVIGLIPTVENMISGHAFRPNDVLVMMNGMTVEISNTDAEGRLILADALHYAKRFNPRGVVDLATLTGVAGIAMGEEMAATLHANDENWAAAILTAGNLSGERLWRMPLWPEYGDAMKSDTADMRNSASSRYAGLGTSAWFLQQFTLTAEGGAAYPWAHMDIAPMDFSSATSGYRIKGSLGYGVRTLVELARQ